MKVTSPILSAAVADSLTQSSCANQHDQVTQVFEATFQYESHDLTV